MISISRCMPNIVWLEYDSVSLFQRALCSPRREGRMCLFISIEASLHQTNPMPFVCWLFHSILYKNMPRLLSRQLRRCRSGRLFPRNNTFFSRAVQALSWHFPSINLLLSPPLCIEDIVKSVVSKVTMPRRAVSCHFKWRYFSCSNYDNCCLICKPTLDLWQGMIITPPSTLRLFILLLSWLVEACVRSYTLS